MFCVSHWQAMAGHGRGPLTQVEVRRAGQIAQHPPMVRAFARPHHAEWVDKEVPGSSSVYG